MRLELEVELLDAPGQLTGVLETVGRFGGNIVTIVHDRSRLRNGRVPVVIHLEAPPEGMGPMLEAVRRDYRVLKAGGARDTVLGAFLLVGHVFQNDLAEVTEAVFGAGAEVRRVRGEVAGRDNPSAVLLDVAAGNDRQLGAALARVRDLARERRYVFLEALGGA